jgi:hypothetical protein
VTPPPDPDDCPHEKELRRGDDVVCVVCGHVTGPPEISVGKGREAIANIRRILHGEEPTR